MITATYHLDFTRDDDDADRRAMGCLNALEPGSRVVIDVGSRRGITRQIYYLRTYISTLHLDVHGAPGVADLWVDALLERGIWERM